MNAYECENCGSLFILNEADERFANGDYCFVNGCNCPLCSCEMILMGEKDLKND